MSALLDRIKELMNQSGVKAKQLTTELGISNSSFTDWSKGKGSPSLDTVTKIADYFQVSIDYLVRGEEFSEPKSLEYSSFTNFMDKELLDKFHSLTPELQEKLLGYVDGMLAAMPKTEDGEKRLSV